MLVNEAELLEIQLFALRTRFTMKQHEGLKYTIKSSKASQNLQIEAQDALGVKRRDRLQYTTELKKLQLLKLPWIAFTCRR